MKSDDFAYWVAYANGESASLHLSKKHPGHDDAMLACSVQSNLSCLANAMPSKYVRTCKVQQTRDIM